VNVTLVEVFADAPFTGNPAAVILLEEPGDADWMQQVAAELNQPATAFLCEDHLRWFSNSRELELCGHGTAGAAHVLFERGLADGRATFRTMYGELAAEAVPGGVELDFPAARTTAEPVEGADRLGLRVVATGRSPLDAIVEVGSAAEVRDYEPDFAALAAIDGRGVIVTAPGDDGRHAIVSRFFSPSHGLPEDAATGSAHYALATWWAPRMGVSFLARQASARGATIGVRLDGDRVRLAGPCRIVLEGELSVSGT
jgi:predicted PhzF superfamily epimerase YddE/YHI9